MMRMVFAAALLSSFCLAACSTPSTGTQNAAADTQPAAPAKTAAKRDPANTGSRLGRSSGDAVNSYDSIVPSGSINKGNAAGVVTSSPQSQTSTPQ